MGLIQYFGDCLLYYCNSGLVRPVLACCLTAGVVRLVMFLFSRGGERQ